MTIEMPADIGDRIRKLREDRGMTSKQLGDLIDRRDGTVRAYEQGRNKPSEDVLRTMCKKLKIPLKQFLGVNGEAKGADEAAAEIARAAAAKSEGHHASPAAVRRVRERMETHYCHERASALREAANYLNAIADHTDNTHAMSDEHIGNLEESFKQRMAHAEKLRREFAEDMSVLPGGQA